MGVMLRQPKPPGVYHGIDIKTVVNLIVKLLQTIIIPHMNWSL